jgi:acyl carrier protein
VTENQLETLRTIFRVVLDLPEETDVGGLKQITMRNWDSLAHVSMVAAIESEYGLHLDSTDHERMTSFEGTRLMLEEKLG